MVAATARRVTSFRRSTKSTGHDRQTPAEIALFPQHVCGGDRRRRAIVLGIIRRQVHRRTRAVRFQDRIREPVEVDVPIVERDRHAAFWQRSRVQPIDRFAKRQHCEACRPQEAESSLELARKDEERRIPKCSSSCAMPWYARMSSRSFRQRVRLAMPNTPAVLMVERAIRLTVEVMDEIPEPREGERYRRGYNPRR
jgi:hypothetical protein